MAKIPRGLVGLSDMEVVQQLLDFIAAYGTIEMIPDEALIPISERLTDALSSKG